MSKIKFKITSIVNGKMVEGCAPAAIVKLPDLSKDPFVLKKTQQATEFILKHGLPERSES